MLFYLPNGLHHRLTVPQFKRLERKNEAKIRICAIRLILRRLIRIIANRFYSTLWVKTVSFRAGQKRHVRVRYSSYHGGSASYFSEGGGRFVSYDFTGGNWRGKVHQSTLTAIFHGKNISIKSVSSDVKPNHLRRRGNWMRYFWKNWEAENEWSVMFTAKGSRWH